MGDRCLECGFEYDDVAPADAAAALRTFPDRYRDALAALDDTVLRTRPSVWTWSALEYACHVRDVFEVYAQRTALVLAEDRPALRSMERDSRVIADRYNEQDPAAVADGLARNAEALAAAFDAVDEDGWRRTGVHPVTGETTLLWMAANVVHEARHHLGDVERVARAAALT